jgi:hypothetical protein
VFSPSTCHPSLKSHQDSIDEDLLDLLDTSTEAEDVPLLFLYRLIQRRFLSELQRERDRHTEEERIRHQETAEAPSVVLLRARAEQAKQPINLQALAHLREAYSRFLGLGRSSDRTLDNDEDMYARIIIPQGNSSQGSEDMIQKRIKMIR